MQCKSLIYINTSFTSTIFLLKLNQFFGYLANTINILIPNKRLFYHFLHIRKLLYTTILAVLEGEPPKLRLHMDGAYV